LPPSCGDEDEHPVLRQRHLATDMLPLGLPAGPAPSWPPARPGAGRRRPMPSGKEPRERRGHRTGQDLVVPDQVDGRETRGCGLRRSTAVMGGWST
jgi:hypothetical protein